MEPSTSFLGGRFYFSLVDPDMLEVLWRAHPCERRLQKHPAHMQHPTLVWKPFTRKG